MTNIKPIIPYLRSVDYKPPLGYLYEGAVTSGTMLSLTDSSANWEIDEWIGKAIKIKRNDELVPAIRKVGTGGVFSLTAGSTFKVFEF